MTGVLKSAPELVIGFVQAWSLLRRLAPDAVIGFGGYAAMPTMLAADRPSLATSPEFIQAACDQHRQIVIALRTRHKRWSSTQMQAHLLASSTRGMSRT